MTDLQIKMIHPRSLPRSKIKMLITEAFSLKARASVNTVNTLLIQTDVDNGIAPLVRAFIFEDPS